MQKEVLELNVGEPQTEREWLMQIDGKLDQLLTCQQDHEDRLRKVEKQQFQWIGRDGMVVAGISGLVALCTIAGALVALKGGV